MARERRRERSTSGHAERKEECRRRHRGVPREHASDGFAVILIR
jgi:hypothetical protein